MYYISITILLFEWTYLNFFLLHILALVIKVENKEQERKRERDKERIKKSYS